MERESSVGEEILGEVSARMLEKLYFLSNLKEDPNASRGQVCMSIYM